jgi:hypothetical protein
MIQLLSFVAIGLCAASVVISLVKTVRMWRAQRRLRVELIKQDALGSAHVRWDQDQQGPEQGSANDAVAAALRSAVAKMEPEDRRVLQPLVRLPIETQARVAFRLASSWSAGELAGK